MRRTLALVLAAPTALLLLAPASGVEDGAAAPEVTGAHVDGTPTVGDPVGTTRPPTLSMDGGPNAQRPDAEGEAGDTEAVDSARRTDGPTAAEVVAPSPPGPAIESTFVVAPVPDAGGVAGSGPRWRYTVEVEPSLGVDAVVVAEAVRAALHDPRSWARTRTLEQVADPARARIRVVLASPATVDELCGRVGLMTAGVYSCWNGRFAALNAWRWEVGAHGFPDITTYRTYLVNHEVGHGLGYGHVGCPAPGAVAPVMMQQSKGLDGCVANGWPTP